VKFSTDGLHLLSIGGDGCIMVWKVADILVKAMKDRLTELFTNAQKRNARAVERQSLGNTSRNKPISVPVAATNIPPPPAPVSKAPPPASLTNLKQKVLHRVNSERASTESTASTNTNSSSGTANKRNRWQEGLDKDAGYELFGKKVLPSPAVENRNKFTLELTSATILNEKTMQHPAMPPLPPTREEEQQATRQPVVASKPSLSTHDEHEDERQHSTSTAADLNEGPGLADHAEYEDGVIHSVSTDDEDESHLFKEPKEEDAYDSDFEPVVSPKEGPSTVEQPDDEETILRAQNKINTLEKSVQDLENWLEEMVRLPFISKYLTSHLSFIFSIATQ
jgi:hypothetical protein